ncbi:hypothetical protein [Microbulbifer sp. HZ11]|uniref:hypothetical protein n=1 Tax=Microbulbifer sp. HZ11 TaxID=1453501 RepID=UPI0005B8787C|nr:hypothetical protein [Microbulbifer sp. HZ11]
MEIDVPDNPFKSKYRWKTYLSPIISNGVEIDEIVGEFVLVKIVHFAKNEKGNRSNFLFAKDASDEEYFVHLQYLTNCEWQDWVKLREGNQLAVLSFDSVKGKAHHVTDCLMINT